MNISFLFFMIFLDVGCLTLSIYYTPNMEFNHINNFISYEMPFLVTGLDMIAFGFGVGVPLPGSFQK